jgi:hypothetical protein
MIHWLALELVTGARKNNHWQKPHGHAFRFQCLPNALAARDVAADDALDVDFSDCGGCCHVADDRMELAFAFALAFEEEGDAVALAREAGRSADFKADDDDDEEDDDDNGVDDDREDSACGIRGRETLAAAVAAPTAVGVAAEAFVLPVAANSEKAADVS